MESLIIYSTEKRVPCLNLEGICLKMAMDDRLSMCGPHKHELAHIFVGHSFMEFLNDEKSRHVHKLTKYNVAPRVWNSLQDWNNDH